MPELLWKLRSAQFEGEVCFRISHITITVFIGVHLQTCISWLISHIFGQVCILDIVTISMIFNIMHIFPYNRPRARPNFLDKLETLQSSLQFLSSLEVVQATSFANRVADLISESLDQDGRLSSYVASSHSSWLHSLIRFDKENC